MQGPARLGQGFRRITPFAARLCAGIGLALVLGLLLAARRSSIRPSGEPPPVPAAFAREVGRYRLTGPRLSVSRRFVPCPARVPPGGSIPRSRCPAPPPRLARARAVRAAVSAAADPGTPAGHAAALAGVLWADAGGISLDRSILHLETAARLAETPAVLADLSGAYLARAEARQTPGDLFRALDAASRAAALQPGNPVACFNRALALEYAGAPRTATDAWRRCAAIDGASPWGGEARRRADALGRAAAGTALAAAPGAGASPAAVDAFVAAEPGAARVHGWANVLGAWGDAVLRGDTVGARRSLSLAAALGDALARRGGDRSLADAVAAIHAAAGSPDGRRRLARGHRAYARGLRTYEEVDRAAAAPYVAELRALHPPSAPLRAWTDRLDAMVLLGQGRYGETAVRLAAAVGRADTRRHPALAASLHQTRGTALQRAGLLEQARDEWSTARRLFHRAGERENAGGTRYLEADAEFQLGVPEAHATLHRALTELRPFRRSRWLHTALAVLGIELATEGLPHAALAAFDEDLGVARAAGTIYETEARLWRAQLLVSMGRQRAAEADIAAAEPVVRGLPKGERRDWFTGDLHTARGVLLLRDAPGAAAAEMDSLLATRDGARTQSRILLGLLGRAQARLSGGDAEGAAADLDSATALLARQRAAVTTPLLGSSILDAARVTFDRLVMLRLARGDTLGALRALERGRLSLARVPGGAPARWDLPAGTAALEYALVGDTLLAWAVTPGGTALHRRTVDRAALLRTVERLRAGLESRASEAELRPLLEGLHGALVAPLRAALPAGGRLAVVADGELADVPYAALYDGRTGRYLVEAYTVSSVSSLRDVRRAPARPPADGARALLVGDPAFDRAAHPGLPRLPGAAAEVTAVRALYRDTVVLPDTAARVRAVLRRLPEAKVFHFAGHAVFDDERPDRSFLLLAPAPDDAAGGRLTAAALGGLKLQGLDLVVLSSCETLRSPGRRSGGFAGLAGALLGAGAGGVVGSPWQVDDGVSRPLMAALHRGYRRTGDAAGALRAAQLAALHDADPALRTPSAWAAFRYVGN